MVFKTYFDKFNTIIEDSEINVGINPIAELCYGPRVTRNLFYFDEKGLRDTFLQNHWVIKNEDGSFALTEEAKGHTKHILHIYNAGSPNPVQMFYEETSSIVEADKKRASSFSLIFFLIPKDWDGGRGYDLAPTLQNQGYTCPKYDFISDSSLNAYSEDGCNWYQARNGCDWHVESGDTATTCCPCETTVSGTADGIYSWETLMKEYEAFHTAEGSKIIIAKQHFDSGLENICVDLTETVNKFLTGELENYGIGIAYEPNIENISLKYENYLGLFTHATNTFFEPYLETIYDDYIHDDRNNFIVGKKNRLYLYSNIGGKLTNLDEMPSCTIEDMPFEVKQYCEGIYYVEIAPSELEFEPQTMYYDTWSNIVCDGVQMPPIELDFVAKAKRHYFNIGDGIEESKKAVPTLYGISENENIYRNDDIRKVGVVCKKMYERNKGLIIQDLSYRIYIMDGTREITVVPYEHANMSFKENYFIVRVKEFIPERYHVDIRIKYNQETITYKKALTFNIVSEIDNKYN